jgi:hypothetical protein
METTTYSHVPTIDVPADVCAAAELLQSWLDAHPIDDCCDLGEGVSEFLDDLIYEPE